MEDEFLARSVDCGRNILVASDQIPSFVFTFDSKTTTTYPGLHLSITDIRPLLAVIDHVLSHHESD